MTSTFLVSSAIYTKHGIFSKDQRLQQTLATLQNVREKVPNTQIYLIESSGAGSVTQEEIALLGKYADAIFDYSRDETIQQIQNIVPSADIVKNFTELWAFNQAIARIYANIDGSTPHPDRLFKLSGRYTLNSQFDFEWYKQSLVQDKFVFAKRRSSQFPVEVTGSAVREQYMSRLWSWPGASLETVKLAYENMLAGFIQANSNKQYLDIEHLLFKEFGSNPNTLEVDQIGVQGELGPNGVIVVD